MPLWMIAAAKSAVSLSVIAALSSAWVNKKTNQTYQSYPACSIWNWDDQLMNTIKSHQSFGNDSDPSLFSRLACRRQRGRWCCCLSQQIHSVPAHQMWVYFRQQSHLWCSARFEGMKGFFSPPLCVPQVAADVETAVREVEEALQLLRERVMWPLRNDLSSRRRIKPKWY